MEPGQHRHLLDETRIREALSSAVVGLWSWDVLADELTFDHYGPIPPNMAQDDLLGSVSSFESVLHPEDLGHVIVAIQQAIQQNTPFEIEHRLKLQANGWQWVRTRGQVVERDPNGRPLRMAGMHWYLTNSQTPQNVMAATSDDYYSTILSSVSDTVLITNDIGDFHYICPNIHIIFGYTAQQITDLHNINRLWDVDLIKQYPPGSFQEISNIEMQINDKFGVSHILLVNIKAVSIFGGTVLFTCRDITERKQAEILSLQESAKAQQYLDIAEVVMVVLDRDANISLINQKGCKALGVTESELVGKSWIQTFIPAQHRTDTSELFNAVITGNLESYEYYENDLIVGSGEWRRFAWHTALCRDLSGEITGLLSSGEDITELRRSEEALRLQTEEIRAQADRIAAINHQLQQQLEENRLAGQALAENEAALATLINNVVVAKW